MTQKLRVGILFGGRSAEHEISILSARNVVAAIDRNRFEPVLIGIDKAGRWRLQNETTLLQSERDPRRVKVTEGMAVGIEPYPSQGTLRSASGTIETLDVIFPVLHGPMGEDGTLQGLLELAAIPYVGSGVLGSAVSMDKDVAKRLLRDAGIPVANFRVLRAVEFKRDAASACRTAAEVGFPLFTKPANLGSSIGVRRVALASELESALAHAFEFDVKALAEAAVPGREVECSVLGGHSPIVSVPGEVTVGHADGFYSYDAKYVSGDGAKIQIPAALTQVEAREVQRLALRAFGVLECEGLARVDFFVRTDGTVLVNEINTLPGFTAISMYPKMWEASGVSQTQLISRLIDLALERSSARRSLKTSYEASQP
ncbi:MAG TPA: D-alanine--D-alanine ligase [Myxococcaceae bacterium]|nr:D-alanine--D-alanine ligase [Myxococcaceae bacterium]